MTGLVAAPFIPIARNLSSHRAAQGIIYTDMLRQAGLNVVPNMSQDLYYEDFNQFDTLYVYHGNDWSGQLNLFGGLREFPHTKNFVNFSKFKGKVRSLVIPFPNYYEQLQHKIRLMKEKGTDGEIDKLWWDVDWDNLQRMERESVMCNPLIMKLYPNAAMGDSHAICMYRPGWMINSVPFKTLHGALKMGLKSFFPTAGVDALHKFEKLEYYFGNIDIRHHLLRQDNPEDATRQLVREYFTQAKEVADETGAEVKIYEPLPIENESRSIPKTGWYNNAPFFGSWADRMYIRSIFIDEALKMETYNVKLFRWTAGLYNTKGELDFKCMEQPKSVHLSREYYPHWQGLEYNKIVKNNLESLFA